MPHLISDKTVSPINSARDKYPLTNDEVSLIQKLSHEDHDMSGLRMRIAENSHTGNVNGTMDDDGDVTPNGGCDSVFDNFD